MKFRLFFALALVSAALMACDKTDGGASSSDPGSGTLQEGVTDQTN